MAVNLLNKMSIETVNNAASYAQVILGILIAIAACIIVYTEGVKEKEFKRQLAQSSLNAAEAIQQAASANTKTAELNLQVEQEVRKRKEAELELEKLRQGLNPRVLTREQARILIQTLSETQLGMVKIIVASGDMETTQYAEQILNALKIAKIDISESTIGVMNPPCYGISIKSEVNLKPLIDAFEQASIPISKPENLILEGFQMIIGLKAMPVF
jgi:hypothetical protein